MLLERTITQLDIGQVSAMRAQELGQLGYMQWLGGLPAQLDYHQAAKRALAVARPFAVGSPAVAVFCDLLGASLRAPLRPLALRLPPRTRRGGARARRAAL